ncbi:MAG: hypothetical protein ACFB9M_16045 [Myxococcota bacterium]
MTRPVDDESMRLGNVLRAWSDAGEAPPTAMMAAIVNDLIEQTRSSRGQPRQEVVDPDAVEVGPDGRARAYRPFALEALVDLLELGLKGLLPGRTGDLMPPHARSGLQRLREWDGAEEDGLDAMQGWLRLEFGPLPADAEVLLCCRASSPMDPQANTIPPPAKSLKTRWREASHIGLRVPASLRQTEGESGEYTAPPDPRTLKRRWREASQASFRIPPDLAASEESASSDPLPVPELDETPEGPRLGDVNGHALHAAQTSTDSVISNPAASSPGEERDTIVEYAPMEQRTVVRREVTRDRPVSLHRAPAARRSAAPRGGSGDSILMPADGSPLQGWLLVVLGVVLGVGAYLAFA